jgi:hypothetical protein
MARWRMLETLKYRTPSFIEFMIRAHFSNRRESATRIIYCSNLVGAPNQRLSFTTTSDEMWSFRCAIAWQLKPYAMSTLDGGRGRPGVGIINRGDKVYH